MGRSKDRREPCQARRLVRAGATRVSSIRSRVIAEDLDHSGDRAALLLLRRVGDGVMTVRFTWRDRTHSNFRRRLLAERKDDL